MENPCWCVDVSLKVELRENRCQSVAFILSYFAIDLVFYKPDDDWIIIGISQTVYFPRKEKCLHKHSKPLFRIVGNIAHFSAPPTAVSHFIFFSSKRIDSCTVEECRCWSRRRSAKWSALWGISRATDVNYKYRPVFLANAQPLSSVDLLEVRLIVNKTSEVLPFCTHSDSSNCDPTFLGLSIDHQLRWMSKRFNEQGIHVLAGET